MSGDAGSIAKVLTLLENHGACTLSARAIDALAPLPVREALHGAGILAGAPPAATWGCDVRGCSREIRSNYDGARLPLVAVCAQAPPECTPVELSFEDVAQQRLSARALVATACALLGAATERAPLSTLDDRVPLGGARRPVLVATTEAPPRDVFWAVSPRDTDLDAFCARRERVARRTLVLVPTGRHVPLEVSARFAAGEAVEILPLSDALVARAGAIALTTARLIAIEPAPDTPRAITGPKRHKTLGVAGGIAAALGVARWEQVRLTMVDEQTVRVQANGKSAIKTFVELGFLDRRKTGSATPVQAWGLFVILCREGGFRPSAYGAMGRKWGAKKATQTVRDALRAAFGLEEDPLLAYSVKWGWRARFLRGQE